MRSFVIPARVIVFSLFLTTAAAAGPAPASRIDDALQNITTIVRPGRVGYATFWDGNKFVQCRRMSNRDLSCEAAGSTMQPSLKNVLTGERLNRLNDLGWTLNPNFGNYVQTFPASVPSPEIADLIVQTMSKVYDADTAGLEISTRWIVDVPCPPRAAKSQNLAGSVNDAPEMRGKLILSCFYTAQTAAAQTAKSATDLVAIYGPTVVAELQRLRINSTRRVYVVFDAGIGYMQCAPETAPAGIYCEAQSAESWPALATVLTPERVALLRKAGYTDPGRAPNYWKNYPADKFNDTAIANKILTLLYDAYGFNGATKLKASTE